MRLLVATLACFLVAASAPAAETVFVRPDDVHVVRLNEGFRIEVEMLAPVSVPIAWKVLTDFGNMTRFVPNLESSRVVAAQANILKVEQRGRAAFGPFSQSFDSVREIELQPLREIVSRQLSGTAKRMESRMRLKPLDDGTTSLAYRADIVPDAPLPPLLGPAFVRHEMAEQFSAIIREMVRRQAATPR